MPLAAKINCSFWYCLWAWQGLLSRPTKRIKLARSMPVSYTHLDVYKRQDQDVLNNFHAEDGYTFEFYLATDERRILESSHDGVRLLVREPIYKPINIVDVLSTEFKK